MRATKVLLVSCVAAALAACGSSRPEPGGTYVVRGLGDPYDTKSGTVHLIRVQDEYRLIRCIPDGPIAGCYEDVLNVPRGEIRWNEWMTVRNVPGLSVAFISPTEVAVRSEEDLGMRR